jgi:hypothetical protein
MKVLRLASTLLLVCAVRLPAQEPPPLSFPDALAAARGRNESILAARSEVRQREEEKKAAKGFYFPTVSFAPLYTHLNDEILLDLNPIRDVILKLHPQVPPSLVPSFEETLFKQDELRLPLTAQWPLFTGGRIRAANRAAGARVRDAEAQTRQAEEGVLRSLVRAYFGLRLALEEKAVRAEVRSGLEQHVRDARRLEEEGLFTSLPSVFLAGFAWPLEAAPSWLRAFSLLVPSTSGIAGFLRLTEMGAALRHVRFEWVVLWALAAAYFLLAWLAERRAEAYERGPDPGA